MSSFILSFALALALVTYIIGANRAVNSLAGVILRLTALLGIVGILIFYGTYIYDGDYTHNRADFIAEKDILVTQDSSETGSTIYGNNATHYYELTNTYYRATLKNNPDCTNIDPHDTTTWCDDALKFYNYQ